MPLRAYSLVSLINLGTCLRIEKLAWFSHQSCSLRYTPLQTQMDSYQLTSYTQLQYNGMMFQTPFQVPKLEVLYHLIINLKPYFGHSPHIPSIDLTYSGHLQFGYLKCPLHRCTGQRDVAQGSFTESTNNPDTASPLRISTLFLFFNEFSPFQWVFSEFLRQFFFGGGSTSTHLTHLTHLVYGFLAWFDP